jgi:hypothetical protein
MMITPLIIVNQVLDIAITLYSLTNTIVIMSSSTCLIMLDQWHLPVGRATSEVRNDTFAWSTDRWNYFVPPYLAPGKYFILFLYRVSF